MLNICYYMHRLYMANIVSYLLHTKLFNSLGFKDNHNDRLSNT
jgi:hypothetical protein